MTATIWHYNGRFYIIHVNARSDDEDLAIQHFYVTCSNIVAENWNDLIWFDCKGIDTSLYFDDDNRVYA
jgi:beta-xylosidase